MAGISGSIRTIRQLFRDDYAIGDFQRGYTWEHEHVATLVRDLARAFQRRRDPEVSGEYYLGAIVTHNRHGYHHIIDGQQRLTTLQLFLMFLKHELEGRDRRKDSALGGLIERTQAGRDAFAIDVKEREDVLQALYEDPDLTARIEPENDTNRNMIDRYMTMAETFPDELRAAATLVKFIDWLLERVVVARIEADKEADAYTIFETTNDRGQKLGAAQLVKNYLQSQIIDPDARDATLGAWTSTMRDLQRFGPSGDVDFITQWFQARHAELPTPEGKPSDLDRIQRDHFGWLKENAVRMGLTSPAAHLEFMAGEFLVMSARYAQLRNAEEFPERGLDSLYFLQNLKIGWTPLVRVATLAGVDPDASTAHNLAKMRAAATFVELFAARLVWQSFNTTALSKYKPLLEEAVYQVRDVDVDTAVNRLTTLIREVPLKIEDSAEVAMPRASGARARNIVHTLLARMSACLDEAFGDTGAYQRYEIRSMARGYSIEHILPSDAKYARANRESHQNYGKRRNRLGALLLIRSVHNQQLADADFATKAATYKDLTRLARTLHPNFYTEDSCAVLDSLGLPFEPVTDGFGPGEVEARQEAYVRLANLTWNPDRIAFAARPGALGDPRVYALPLDRSVDSL